MEGRGKDRVYRMVGLQYVIRRKSEDAEREAHVIMDPQYRFPIILYVGWELQNQETNAGNWVLFP